MTLRYTQFRFSKGFTLVELMLVISIMGILMSFAIPSFNEWRQRQQYKEVTRDIASMLRLAKTGAIAKNREYRVELDVAGARFGLRPGNRAVNTSWSDLDSNPMPARWKLLPAGVNLAASIAAIEFNPNGTANLGGLLSTIVSIQDESAATKYEVEVASSGRVRIR